ncbi:glycerol transport activity [Micractinium conductrix]|uniref:Glycerol transport activity n=1 Tax=Micractinium conductrix TaxID=554055 RepID=A0A2P6VIG7_9CHLO|nr:glycerol transport activity [Micractinium conductrix]|eukprot:PSC73881.1 glycerol transport activity [Micractinium conductrix]
MAVVVDKWNDFIDWCRSPALPYEKFGECGDVESSNKKLYAALAAEFMGMLLFALYGGEARDQAAAYGNGLALAILVYATANISGGHLNPAVTLGTMISGHLPWRRAACSTWAPSVLFQVALIPDAHVNMGNEGPGCFTHLGGQYIRKDQLFGWELVMTFVLVSVVYAVAISNPGHGNIGPLAVGYTLFASAFIGGPLTGAALNPARVFGPALIYNCYWSTAPIYIIAEHLGGAIAAVLALMLYGPGPEHGAGHEANPLAVQMSAPSGHGAKAERQGLINVLVIPADEQLEIAANTMIQEVQGSVNTLREEQKKIRSSVNAMQGSVNTLPCSVSAMQEEQSRVREEQNTLLGSVFDVSRLPCQKRRRRPYTPAALASDCGLAHDAAAESRLAAKLLDEHAAAHQFRKLLMRVLCKQAKDSEAKQEEDGSTAVVSSWRSLPQPVTAAEWTHEAQLLGQVAGALKPISEVQQAVLLLRKYCAAAAREETEGRGPLLQLLESTPPPGALEWPPAMALALALGGKWSRELEFDVALRVIRDEDSIIIIQESKLRATGISKALRQLRQAFRLVAWLHFALGAALPRLEGRIVVPGSELRAAQRKLRGASGTVQDSVPGEAGAKFTMSVKADTA